MTNTSATLIKQIVGALSGEPLDWYCFPEGCREMRSHRQLMSSKSRTRVNALRLCLLLWHPFCSEGMLLASCASPLQGRGWSLQGSWTRWPLRVPSISNDSCVAQKSSTTIWFSISFWAACVLWRKICGALTEKFWLQKGQLRKRKHRAWAWEA